MLHQHRHLFLLTEVVYRYRISVGRKQRPPSPQYYAARQPPPRSWPPVSRMGQSSPSYVCCTASCCAIPSTAEGFISDTMVLLGTRKERCSPILERTIFLCCCAFSRKRHRCTRRRRMARGDCSHRRAVQQWPVRWGIVGSK